MHGYHGKALKIDFTTEASETILLTDLELATFVGGTGLGTWLLLRESPANVDPLGPEAPLVFAFSPLVGSPLTTSAKFAIVAKSPLTHRLNDALSSSHFAIEGKKTGFDAFILKGAAANWSVLVIDNGAVRLEPADRLLGLSAQDTSAALRERWGSQFRIAAIGPAGERSIPYATLSNDGRHAGRGGIGAVLGSKRIKAIAVRGDQRTSLAHPDEVMRYSKKLSQLSYGPATEKYRELGTVANLLTFNRFGTLPTRNFQSGVFDAAEDLDPGSQSLSRVRTSCAACTIGCEHIFQPSREPGSGVRLEYESLFALGSLCGVSNPDDVLSAAAYCDEAGLDTISAGASIAFAMECVERNLLDAPRLRFGDGAAVLQALRDIVEGDGIGKLLACGVRTMAEEIGGDSANFAPHVKGLEMPGYDPRGLQTMALGFAIGTRGADHNRSGAYQIDFSDRVDRMNPGEAAVAGAVESENEATLMDSLILCKFLRGVFEDRIGSMAEMVSLVTGHVRSREELLTTAERLVTLKKWFNIRQGWTPAEDWLPERFFDAPLAEGASEGAVLTRQGLRAQITGYNRLRGWTDEGWILPEQLRGLFPEEITEWMAT